MPKQFTIKTIEPAVKPKFKLSAISDDRRTLMYIAINWGTDLADLAFNFLNKKYGLTKDDMYEIFADPDNVDYIEPYITNWDLVRAFREVRKEMEKEGTWPKEPRFSMPNLNIKYITNFIICTTFCTTTIMIPCILVVPVTMALIGAMCFAANTVCEKFIKNHKILIGLFALEYVSIAIKIAPSVLEGTTSWGNSRMRNLESILIY